VEQLRALPPDAELPVGFTIAELLDKLTPPPAPPGSVFRLDPDRLAAAGGSAGGQLSAMAALTPGRFEGSGGHADQRSEVQAIVLWYPVVDMRLAGRTDESAQPITRFLGDPTDDRALVASPIAYVSRACPPVLTISGDADPVSILAHNQAFHAALDAHGASNRLEVFEAGHGFDVSPAYWDRSFELLADFLDEHLPVARPAQSGTGSAPPV